MDRISSFAKELVGGAELKSDWNISTAKMAGKAHGIARGIQKRGMGMLRKHAPNLAGSVARYGGNKLRSFMSKGKSIDGKVQESGGTVRVGQSAASPIVGNPTANNPVVGNTPTAPIAGNPSSAATSAPIIGSPTNRASSRAAFSPMKAGRVGSSSKPTPPTGPSTPPSAS